MGKHKKKSKQIIPLLSGKSADKLDRLVAKLCLQQGRSFYESINDLDPVYMRRH